MVRQAGAERGRGEEVLLVERNTYLWVSLVKERAKAMRNRIPERGDLYTTASCHRYIMHT